MQPHSPLNELSEEAILLVKFFYLWVFQCNTWEGSIQSSFRTSLEGPISAGVFVCIPLILSWTLHSPAFPVSASLWTVPGNRYAGLASAELLPFPMRALPLVLIHVCPLHCIHFLSLLVPGSLASLLAALEVNFQKSPIFFQAV